MHTHIQAEFLELNQIFLTKMSLQRVSHKSFSELIIGKSCRPKFPWEMKRMSTALTSLTLPCQIPCQIQIKLPNAKHPTRTGVWQVTHF